MQNLKSSGTSILYQFQIFNERPNRQVKEIKNRVIKNKIITSTKWLKTTYHQEMSNSKQKFTFDSDAILEILKIETANNS